MGASFNSNLEYLVYCIDCLDKHIIRLKGLSIDDHDHFRSASNSDNQGAKVAESVAQH